MPLSEIQQRFAQAVRRPESDIDLTTTALLFAKLEYADLDVAGTQATLRALADRAEAAAPRNLDAVQRLRRLARFFRASGFHGDRDNYYDPRNSYLNQVLERRRGIPISLSVLLMEVGRHIGLPLHGVALPAHFMVKWQDGADELFVDAFNDCDLLTPEECRGRVEAAAGRPVTLVPSHFARVGNRAVLRRMLNNLRGVYLSARDVLRATRIVELLLILDPDNASDLRDLGHLYRAVGRVGESAVCLERYLELEPNAPDVEAIERLLDSGDGRNWGGHTGSSTA